MRMDERGARLDSAHTDIRLREVLDGAVLAGPAVEEVASEIRAVVQGEGEEGRRVGEAGEVDDADVAPWIKLKSAFGVLG